MRSNQSSRLNNLQKLQSKNKNSLMVDRPYIAQYKNFEERLNNPRLNNKHSSFILRKPKNNKQNISQIEEIYQSTKSFLLKSSSIIQINQQEKLFKTESEIIPISEEIDLKNRQQDLVSRFKDKIWNLKFKGNESQSCSTKISRISTIKPLSLRKNLTQISNLSLKQQKDCGSKLQNNAYKKLLKQKQNNKLSFMKYKKDKNIILQKLAPKYLLR